MSDVFLSYSHHDLEIARRLAVALKQRGQDVWRDHEDIRWGSNWSEELERAIEGAHTLVFLVSPDSSVSANCRRELALAGELGKRIAAVCVRATDPSTAPPQVAALQWVPTPGVFDDAFEQHVSALDALLRTDLDLLRTQALVHERSKAWDMSGRRPSPLLRGDELRAADAWIVRAEAGVEPQPTSLQREFIEESVRREGRRRRRVVVGSLAVANVAIVLMVFAFIQRSSAVRERKSATSRELAAQSLLQLESDPELSLLLALESAKVRHTPETLAALHRSLAADHLRRLLPGGGPLRPVAWSADGRLVAAGGAVQHAELRIWDARTGRLLHRLPTAAFAFRSLAFDPRGERLLAAPREGDALIWPFASGGRSIALPTGDFRSPYAAWSPDSRSVLVTPGVTAPATLFDVATGRVSRRFGGNGPSDAEFSPDGRTVATAGPGPLAHVWRTADGHELGAMSASGPSTGTFQGASGTVLSVRFSSRGHYLLTAADDGTARIFDLGDGRQVAGMPPHADAVRLAVWSPDGNHVATASADHTARVWDPRTGGSFLVLRGHAGRVESVAFSPDGENLLTAGDDGLAQVFDTATGTTVAQFRGHGNSVVGAAFSPDGRTVLTAGEDGTARIWDAAIVRPIASGVIALGADARIVGIQADGLADPTSPRLVLHDDPLSAHAFVPGATIVDTLTGRRVATLTDAHANVTAASFDRDGGLLFTAGKDRNFHAVAGTLWDGRTGQLRRMLAGPGSAAVHGVLSDDGARLATVDVNAMVSVWDTAAGHRIATFRGHVGHRAPYELFVSLTWSHDATLLLTADTSGKAYVWRARDATVLNTFSGPKQAPRSDNSVPGGAISPDDRTVLFTDPWDPAGYLYRVGQEASIGTLRGTSRGIRNARFSTDGSLVVTNGGDGDRVWDVASRQPILTLPDNAALAGFSSDGRTIVSSGPTVLHGVRYRKSFACDVCGGIDTLIALAGQRASRSLTPTEQAQYLHA